MFLSNDRSAKKTRHLFSCKLVFLPEKEKCSLIRKLHPLLGLCVDLTSENLTHFHETWRENYVSDL
jgi:hypothetical protein